MARLNKDVKEEIITRIKQGISLNKISKSSGIRKSTLYYYYKKIKGKRYQPPKFKINYTEKEGEILGTFIGDGSQHYAKNNYHYQTTIHFGNCPDYAFHVQRLFEDYFNKKWSLYKDIRNNGRIQYRLRVLDKIIFDYFANYISYNKHHKHDTVSLITTKLPIAFKLGLLRGLVDTDGTICKCKDGRIRIQFYTTSKKLAEQTKEILEFLNMNCFLSKVIRPEFKPIFLVSIYKKDVAKFIKQIQPFKARNLILNV